MKARLAAAALAILVAGALGCSSTTRYRVLNFFFDGVPRPRAAPAALPATAVESTGGARPAGFFEHGPYAAKLCSGCHATGAMNTLVAAGDQLCSRCHALRLDRRYVHGPLASGGCLACHEPHSSPYRHLLVSASDGFCLRCHDRAALKPIPGHAGQAEDCTACHDAHMSDRRYLLK
jgi:predicted CXXCH cytochrome family protein